MQDTKKWYRSLTANGSIAGAVVSAASIASIVSGKPAIVPIAQLVVDQGFPLVGAIATFITSIMTLFGRIRADTKIGK